MLAPSLSVSYELPVCSKEVVHFQAHQSHDMEHWRLQSHWLIETVALCLIHCVRGKEWEEIMGGEIVLNLHMILLVSFTAHQMWWLCFNTNINQSWERAWMLKNLWWKRLSYYMSNCFPFTHTLVTSIWIIVKNCAISECFCPFFQDNLNFQCLAVMTCNNS